MTEPTTETSKTSETPTPESLKARISELESELDKLKSEGALAEKQSSFRAWVIDYIDRRTADSVSSREMASLAADYIDDKGKKWVTRVSAAVVIAAAVLAFLGVSGFKDSVLKEAKRLNKSDLKKILDTGVAEVSSLRRHGERQLATLKARVAASHADLDSSLIRAKRRMETEVQAVRNQRSELAREFGRLEGEQSNASKVLSKTLIQGQERATKELKATQAKAIHELEKNLKELRGKHEKAHRNAETLVENLRARKKEADQVATDLQRLKRLFREKGGTGSFEEVVKHLSHLRGFFDKKGPKAAETFVAELLAEVGRATPIGSVVAWPLEAKLIPPGWLLCDGRTHFLGRYPRVRQRVRAGEWLYASAEAAGTFNVPDYRGYFLRGLDNPLGKPGQRDPGPRYLQGKPSSTARVGSTQTDQVQSHQHSLPQYTEYHGSQSTRDMWAMSRILQSNRRDFRSSTDASGGKETRPKNVSVNWIVYVGQRMPK